MPTYDYSRDQILKEVGSGEDAKRRAAIDAEVAKAKAGDASAIERIRGLADLDGPGGSGAATRDGRNYARLMLNEHFGGQHEYMEKGDGGGFVASLGNVLKDVAPFAAPLIPGLGWLGAGALAAGASAAGGELAGDDFDLKKTLMAGVAGGAGNALLGGQGYKGIGGIPSRLGLTGAGGGAGNVTAAGTAGTQGGPGVLGKIGNFIGGPDGFGLDDAAKVAGLVTATNRQHSADERMNDAVEGATRDYGDRKPLRDAALAGILDLPNTRRPDMSGVFYDPGNTYNKVSAPGATPATGATPPFVGPRPLTTRYAGVPPLRSNQPTRRPY